MGKAIEHLRRAVALKPGYVEAWLSLGTTLRESGDLDGATEALRKALALDDRDFGAYNSLGLILRLKGDTVGSRAAFAKAAELKNTEERDKSRLLRQGPARRQQ